MNIVIERGKIWTVEEIPPFSIALDGAIQGPHMDNNENRYSFDHHAGCIRHSTNCTAKQVFDALMLGFDPSGFTVYINDVDADTALAVWLLKNPQKITHQMVRKIVDVVNIRDCHGPAYPLDNKEKNTEKLVYDFAMKSEREARKNKTYQTEDLRELLNSCLEGFDEVIKSGMFVTFGKTKTESVKAEVFAHSEEIVMMDSPQFGAFEEAYKIANTAICFQKLPDNTYAYTIGKKSEFVRFSVTEALRKLNEVEPGWGGGSTIGGAPRNADGSRSKLDPYQVWEIITI